MNIEQSDNSTSLKINDSSNMTPDKSESDKDENSLNASSDNQPFFIMTLEFEKGKQKKIKIFPNSDPTELSFNFCKENNLDFVSMKYLTNEIQSLLNKYNENKSKFNANLIVNGSNNSIQEVEEENMLTEKTCEQKMSERSSSAVEKKNEAKANGNFIYSSLENNEEDIDEQAEEESQSEDAKIKKEQEEIEKMLNKKIEENEEKNIYIEKEYNDSQYENSSDSKSTEHKKISIKYKNNHHEERNNTVSIEVKDTSSIKNEKLNKTDRVIVKRSFDSSKEELSKTLNELKNDLIPQKELAIKRNSLQSELSPKIPTISSNLQIKTENDNYSEIIAPLSDISALLEIKRKKDLLNLQLEEEMKKEQMITEQKLKEQQRLEEEDKKEREEYLQYEQKQKMTNSKQKLILDEVDYNFQLEEIADKENTINLNSKNSNRSKEKSTLNPPLSQKSNSFSSSSNKPPLTYTNQNKSSIHDSHNVSKNLPPEPTSATTQIVLKTSTAKPKLQNQNLSETSKKNQKLFSYELLTENDAYESYCLQNGALYSSQSTQSMGISAMISAANSNRNNNFISQRQKTSNDLSRSNSYNIFEKLYNEAEINRQLPKRPCHFSYRVNNMSDIYSDEETTKHAKTSNGNYGEYLYIKGKIQNELKREKIAKYKYNLNLALRALCKSKPKINKYKRNLSLGVINKNFAQKKEETDNGRKKEKNGKQNQNSSGNVISNGSKKKKIQLLTKRNLENPLLKKKLEQIKKEIEKKYTFRPKINDNYHFSPGLNFMQRQEIYNDYLSKKNNLKEEICTSNFTHKKISTNKNSQHPSKLIKQKKNYNTFNKNIDLTSNSNYIKTNISQTHISLYKTSSSNSKKPFLCTSPNTTTKNDKINTKKKKEIFKQIFNLIDKDKDGQISYATYNKNAIPQKIHKIISPMINQMISHKAVISKENFFDNMEEIYKDLNLNDKRGLFDFFAKKDRPRSHSRRAESSSKNKRKEKLVESYDKKLIQSLSLNNIVNKKIDKNEYFKKIKNGGDKSMSHIANIKNYTFSRYKKNQSYD